MTTVQEEGRRRCRPQPSRRSCAYEMPHALGLQECRPPFLQTQPESQRRTDRGAWVTAITAACGGPCDPPQGMNREESECRRQRFLLRAGGGAVGRRQNWVSVHVVRPSSPHLLQRGEHRLVELGSGRGRQADREGGDHTLLAG